MVELTASEQYAVCVQTLALLDNESYSMFSLYFHQTIYKLYMLGFEMADIVLECVEKVNG